MTKPTGNPRGKPSNKRLAEAGKRPVGRPRDEVKAIIEEYTHRMLASPKSARVLEKMFEVALTDGHPGQVACMKMVVDRVVPMSALDPTKAGGNSVPQISINISGLSTPTIQTTEDYIDVEPKDSDTQ